MGLEPTTGARLADLGAFAEGAHMRFRTALLGIGCLWATICTDVIAGVDRVPIWNDVLTLDADYVRGQVDAAGFGPDNQVFTAIDRISVHSHAAAEWNCTFVFMLDQMRSQITVLHSEGNGAEPSEIVVDVDGCTEVPMRGAWDMVAVADYGFGAKSFASQPIHWRVFVVDKEARSVFILHYLTHQYDVRGHRVRGARYWTTTPIGEGTVERPVAIASFSDVNSTDNAFVLVDENDGAICIVGTDNTLFGRINMASIGFSELRASNVGACMYRDTKYIAVVGDENGRSRLVLMSSPDREFASPSIVGSWLFDEVADISLTADLGLWALLGSGRGFARSHDGFESHDVGFSSSMAALPVCIAACGQFVYPVARYGAASGLEKYRSTDALHVATAKRKYFSDLEPAVCEYGIREVEGYRLHMKIADDGSLQWYNLTGSSDFSPGPHTRSVNLPQPGSGSSMGWFVLNKDTGGGAPLELQSDPFVVSMGPTGSITVPVDGTQFRSGTRTTTIEFNLDYGSGSINAARVELIKLDTGLIVSNAVVALPGNGPVSVNMSLPSDDDCWADSYLMRLWADYGIGPTSKLLQTIHVSVRKLDGCDGGDDPGTPMDPPGANGGATPGGGGSDAQVNPDRSVEMVYYSNGQIVVVAGEAEIAHISVYDLRGRKLMSRNAAGLASPMSESAFEERLAAGFYFARLYRSDGTYVSRKFVVVK